MSRVQCVQSPQLGKDKGQGSFSPLPSPETTNTAPLPVGGYKNTCFSQIALHHGVQDSLPLFLVKHSVDGAVWFSMSNPGAGAGLEPLKGSTDGLERLLHGRAGDSEGSQPRTGQFSPAECPSSQPSSAPQTVPVQPSLAAGLSPSSGAIPPVSRQPRPCVRLRRRCSFTCRDGHFTFPSPAAPPGSS